MKRSLSPLLIASTILLVCQGSSAADCEKCEKYVKAIQKQEALREKMRKIIDRNRSVMQRLPRSETSKKIKLNSNILIATVNIETYENNLTLLSNQFQEKGCTSCGMQINPTVADDLPTEEN